MSEVQGLSDPSNIYLPVSNDPWPMLSEVVSPAFQQAVLDAGGWPANLGSARLRPELVEAVGGYQELLNGLKEQKATFEFLEEHHQTVTVYCDYLWNKQISADMQGLAKAMQISGAIGFLVLGALTTWTLTRKQLTKLHQSLVAISGLGALSSAWICLWGHKIKPAARKAVECKLASYFAEQGLPDINEVASRSGDMAVAQVRRAIAEHIYATDPIVRLYATMDSENPMVRLGLAARKRVLAEQLRQVGATIERRPVFFTMDQLFSESVFEQNEASHAVWESLMESVRDAGDGRRFREVRQLRKGEFIDIAGSGSG